MFKIHLKKSNKNNNHTDLKQTILKKITSAIILSIAFVLCLCSFANGSYNTSGLTATSGFYVAIPETLVNEEYGQSLSLYTSGKCFVQTDDAMGYGTYDLTSDGLIKINWDNGYEQEGTYTKIIDVNGNRRIKTVKVNGVTYTNTERFVVKRPR